MLGLPEMTVYGKRVPKIKFLGGGRAPSEAKRILSKGVEAICWQNKIAPSTVHVGEGRRVSEIQVFELRLTAVDLDLQPVLRLIDSAIPYHILFVLSFEDRIQAWIGYKEIPKNGVPKVERYYNTGWIGADDLELSLKGLDMDSVYDGLVRQIAGERLERIKVVSLDSAVKLDEQRMRILERIAALRRKIRNEAQFNRQVQMNSQVRNLEKELDMIENGIDIERR